MTTQALSVMKGELKDFHCDGLLAIKTALRPLNFQEKVGMEVKRQHTVVETVDEVIERAKEINASIGVRNGQICIYNGAFWKPYLKNEIECFLGESSALLGVDKYEAKHYQFRNELFKQLITSALSIKSHLKSTEVKINLLNGTFVISDNTIGLLGFKQDDYLFYQLPFKYDKEATCSIFMEFLNYVLPNKDDQQLLSEYIGYVFIRNKELKLEKCLVLYGKGANGKSVFFDIINALLGKENVSSYSLKSLTNECGYQRATLGSKLLNYSSELSNHMDSSYFKQLVSGEAIEARLPYGIPFILEDYAKFIFNANDLPRDVENNEAFFRRFVILSFNVTIPEHQRNPSLAQRIINTELPGIFNWVLEGLSRILEQRGFSRSKGSENILADYKLASDSVRQFLNDHMYHPSFEKTIILHDFYVAYNRYTQDSGSRPLSKKGFAERLRNLQYNLTRTNKGMTVYTEKELYHDSLTSSNTQLSVIEQV
jgi:putative DNA primase/helicase